MKNKIFLCFAFLMGLILASCNDDDYTIYTSPLLNADSVTTGSADVTATSATMHGSVAGLNGMAASSYTVGFNYGTSQDALKESVNGSLADGSFSGTVAGLMDGTVLYYQAFVTLQGRVTYTGEIKQLITTDATVTTADASGIDHAGATAGGSVSGAPAGTVYGIAIATSSDPEAVRAGLHVQAGDNATFAKAINGLVPSTTYHYAAYADLGPGKVYGDVKSFTTSPYDFDLEGGLVDLGLSVKWAAFNLGARSASEAGGLFGYGDLTGVKNSIDAADYASGDIYRTGSDVANTAWSGSVTLPTADQFEELFARCSKKWTEQDGVSGFLLTGPSGNSIFLPAAGKRVINDVIGAETVGNYATGSINPSDGSFAVDFTFSEGASTRSTAPVYEGLSVRPVSTAHKAAFVKENLFTTWEIDYKDGKSQTFNGPVWFMGTGDSWRTISNGEPIVGDSWLWDADASNTWAFGDCTGYMTFDADGNVTVKNPGQDEVTGKYTIDEKTMTITADVDLLAPDNFKDPMVCNRKNQIKILSLGGDRMQLGYYRDSDPCTLCVNMIPQLYKYGYDIRLLCVGGDWGGTWGETLTTLGAADVAGKHTVRYEGAVNGAMVFTLDAVNLATAYPDAIMTVTDIRCDGQSIKFDPAKFRYGNIEQGANIRVELFNIWGKASQGGKVDSPFSAGGLMDSDPAFTFADNVEFDIYISTDGVFQPNLITINKDWGGPWDYSEGATFKVVADSDCRLAIENPTIDMTFNAGGTDFSAGTIMTFIEVAGLKGLCPGTHATLDGLWLDGVEKSFDKSKVVDTNEGNKYRLELWNCYGATSGSGCAFGERQGDVMPGLGFTDTMRLRFTFESLFAPVTF